VRIFVTGGTGFVGTRLLPALQAAGHTLVLLAREAESAAGVPEGIEVVRGDPMQPGPWWDPVARCDAAVNLAGAPVFSRWDAAGKVAIRESRLATTRNLATRVPRDRPFSLVSASGIGIYGDAGERELTESSPPGGDFLARVAREWEDEALRARDRGARVCLARFGIVLGRGGGALEEMAKAARRFLGGALGSGRQWMAWVHLEDVVRGLGFLLERDDSEGPYNFCSPNPARQVEVARAVGRALRRPALAWAPAPALRLFLGECAQVVLSSQKASPVRLRKAGFRFLYPELEPALRQILAPEPSA